MNLGQVYTKEAVAQYMVSLFSLPSQAKVLDPCFGRGVFIDALNKDKRYIAEGIEIDTDSYMSYTGNVTKHHLHKGDFFSLGKSNNYDGIIMNPPYVRQEEINDMQDTYNINKDKLQKIIGIEIDKKANLYMYFLIYALQLLKKEGELIVIFPNSWEKAKVGVKFKKALNSLCQIEQQISVIGNPFTSTPIVEVVILKLKKTSQIIQTVHKEIRIENDTVTEQESVSKAPVEFDKAVPLSWFAQIRRGKSTGCNRIFINPKLPCTQCLVDILSSPKDIIGFSTAKAKTNKYLFITSKNTTLEEPVKEYLAQCADYIKSQKAPKSLYKQILQEPYWFVTKDIGIGDIIFPYIIRNSIRFILNEKRLPIRDNFYSINSTLDRYLLMALLNNYFIGYQLEKNGKTYGNSMLKIQKYDMDNLMIISPEAISEEDKEKLRELSKALVDSSNINRISDITSILAQYYGIKNIEELFHDTRKKRLNQQI